MGKSDVELVKKGPGRFSIILVDGELRREVDLILSESGELKDMIFGRWSTPESEGFCKMRNPDGTTHLPFSDPTDWHWRWQLSHTGSGVLHRVEMYTKIWGREGDPLNDDESDLAIRGCDALTVCGRYMHMYMPGLFERTGNPRCKRCCKLLGIPEGDGAPFNEDIDA